MSLFSGKTYNSIDKKNRVIIPAKYRGKFDGRCIVAKGLDPCIDVYTKEAWQTFIEEKISKLPESDPNARKLQRYYYANSEEADIDAQGRVTLPPEYVEYAKIDKELATIGSGGKLEIWSKDAKEIKDLEDIDPSKLAQELGLPNIL